MSKRHGDPSYEDLLAMGFLSEAVVNYVALLGWSPKGEESEREFFTLDELSHSFDIGGISKSPAIFDREKLKYFNAKYLRAMDADAFCAAAEPYLRQAVRNPAIDWKLIAPLVQPRCDTFEDIAPQVDFFDALPDYSTELYVHKKMKANLENSLEALQQVLPVLEQLEPWTYDSIHDALIGLAERLKLKNGRIMWPVRTALSGKAVTPGGAVELCQILARTRRSAASGPAWKSWPSDRLYPSGVLLREDAAFSSSIRTGTYSSTTLVATCSVKARSCSTKIMVGWYVSKRSSICIRAYTSTKFSGSSQR
jgi:glutamyl-tRNA synthetase